jgi:hypothetical protein
MLTNLLILYQEQLHNNVLDVSERQTQLGQVRYFPFESRIHLPKFNGSLGNGKNDETFGTYIGRVRATWRTY